MSQIISASSNSGATVIRTVSKCIKFTLISYLVSVLFLALLAVIIVYTDIPENISGPSVKGITLLGAFLSAFLTSKSCEAKGWLCGLLAGAFNVAALRFIGALIADSLVFSKANMILIAGGALCGMIGGIIGVNSGNNQ